MSKINIFWHRRDLRLHDNAGAYHALSESLPVLPVFIFDRHILDELDDDTDARITFLHDEMQALRKQLREMGSSMIVRYGFPKEELENLCQEFDVNAVYTNRDYEPYAKERDAAVQRMLQDQGIDFHTFKDQVIFEGLEVEKKAGGAYTVFTPYSRMWLKNVDTRKIDSDGKEISVNYQSYPNEALFGNYHQIKEQALPSLEEMGFRRSGIKIPPKTVSQGLIKQYDETRNIPAIEGTSRLSVHFRFGTISIREKARKAERLNDAFLNELIWREFYMQILDNFPHVVEKSFRPEYDYIEWRNNEAEFERWCNGETGYPIVDAGMRQLNETGYMHNRLRMITASFLTKHLLCDWRWGEAYFGKKLLDYELSSNNGGWQWAAGSGTDAQPYFRIFNPYTQVDKFDKNREYIRRYVPEFERSSYPDPVVEHKFARERCLEVFKSGLDKGKADLAS